MTVRLSTVASGLRHRIAATTALAVRILAVAALGLLLPRATRAAPVAAQGAAQEPEGAKVVLVGDVAGMTELEATLVELLERDNVRPHVVRVPGFDRDDVLSGGKPDDGVSAFVVPETATSARLYFRGPHAQRFLLRGLGLRNGLDEYGRELVAQVVESSVLALLRSNAGITLEQASAELARTPGAGGTDAARTESPNVPTSEAKAPARTDAATPGSSRAPASTGPLQWRGWLAARYALEWAGSDLGAAHGPGLEMGVEWGVLRTRITAERWFAQNIAAPDLSANVQTTALRLLVDTRWPWRTTHALVAGLGAGIDILGVQATASRDPALTLAPERSHAVPAVRAEVGYQVRGDPWRFMALAFVDGALLDTHYDVERAGAAVRVATPWSVRPGVALVLGWSPPLGGQN